ncbi:MAG: heavy metal translocating P-type ATPase, partial [Treponema sp.]|nr:heavy metal translocating P-type ATPase [Treponema sp.]
METQGKSIMTRHVEDACCEHCAKALEEGEQAEPSGWERWSGPLSSGLGAVFFAAALLLQKFMPDLPEFLFFGVFIIAYLLAGGEVLLRAAKNIRAGQVFDENFLMAVASLGAFCIGEYPEGVAVMLFYQIGEAFQDLAVRRSRSSISALMDIRPDYANIKRGNDYERVSPKDVHPGDLILVKPGEKIPLDGVVVEGRSALDCSALTGESLPRDAESGSEVLSGSINKTGPLIVKVTKEFGESTAAKILELVQNAGSKKAPVENFITRFARYYTPVVVFSALALALIPPLVLAIGGTVDQTASFFPAFIAIFPSWLHRALVFLVVSCPCALVISVPLSFFGGIGGASRRGILVKGGNYLEALNRADTVVFDKTGTLTKGVFTVTKTISAPPFSPEELLRYAAAAESFSNHPIARSIQQAAAGQGAAPSSAAHEEIPGRGVRLHLEGKTILAGNARLLAEHQIPCPTVEAPGTVVYVACDG